LPGRDRVGRGQAISPAQADDAVRNGKPPVTRS